MLTLPSEASDEARDLARGLGITVTAASVLIRRGRVEPEGAARFFDPKLAHLTPPTLMKDRAEASARLVRAVRAKERVCIFGDYDADGITSAAIMTDVLRTLGADVTTVLADRFDGGYGLSTPALDRITATGATLLVTCDCGSSDHERLEDARRRGIDVIVIDHHRVPDEPLPALAFLNPHRPDCGFPYKGLASCGLALSICAALRAELGVALDLRNWLDLVALGTIADVAPLDGDNRALVRAGLAVLATGARPGIRALAEVAGHAGSTPLTGEDVAFRFAPRINAPGRLKSPDLALALLLAKTVDEARGLAAEVDQICEQRKTVDRALLAEALAMLADPALAALPVIVLGKEGWHQGVVGIVAGRLASRFGKPTIVIGFDGATGRGSVRGPAGARLHDALSQCGHALLGFGGHQAAAGVHVEAKSLDALRDAFAAACVSLGTELAPTNVVADAILEASDRPADVFRDLERFEPCGHANPAPLLGMRQVRVRGAREVRGGHLKIEVESGFGALSGFGFELGHLAAKLGGGARVDIVAKIRRDTYRGNGAVELRLEAVDVPPHDEAAASGPTAR